jgi:hypothetical protein
MSSWMMVSKIPQGYKVASENKSDIGWHLELIPEGESLSQWTEMLTVQVLRNTGGWTLSGFQADVEKSWVAMFPGGSVQIIERGCEELQPTLIWSQACPLNKSTGKPENTWFKVLISGGNLVIIQKAFKFDPPPEAVAFWIAFLKEARVNSQL